MDCDEYALTDADVLDTLQFVVAAERRAEAAMAETEAEPDAPAAKPYQNRQKQELDYLKAKVRELELELRQLERANDDKLANAGDATWQRIAQQQFLEKQKALSENARLKDELEGQLKFAKSLERVIRKRPNLSAFGGGDDSETSRRVVRRRKKRHGSGGNSAAVFDELSETCEREFRRTDEALAASGLASFLRDYRNIEVKVIDDDAASVSSSSSSTNAAPGDLRVDWTIARRYPFPFQSVARELWKLLAYNQVPAPASDMDRTVERTDDTLFASTSLSVLLGKRQCTLSASAIIRLYVEEDCVTVVWVSDGECETSKFAKDTFKLYEVGWIKMQPIPDDPSSCISHTLGYYYPTFSARTRQSPSSSPSDTEGVGSPLDAGLTPQDSEDVGLLTELLASVYDKSASQIHTAIENALMFEAIAQPKTEPGTSLTL